MQALKLNENSIRDEIAKCMSGIGKRTEFVYSFLVFWGYSSLSEITCITLRSFISTVRKEYAFDPSKYSSHKGDLEAVVFSYMKSVGCPLALSPLSENVRARKCLVFLFASGITSFSEITAVTRREYSEYLKLSVPSKYSEYMKELDKMVLSEIEKITIVRPPQYASRLLYLGYFPDPFIARKFYYTAGKNVLYFDLSLPVSVTLKTQVFRILLSDLEQLKRRPNHYVIQHFLTPLHHLYAYCAEAGIRDIKQISGKEADGFEKFLSEKTSTVCRNTFQVLYRAKKHLFLTDKKPDFTAITWFLERFNLGVRENPTRKIDCFYFGDISEMDRRYLQNFMRYLLVLSPKYSLRYILEKYYNAKDFVRFIEKRNVYLTDLSYTDMEDFIKLKNSQDLNPETFNLILSQLSFFLTVLSVRENLLIPSFPFEYFYKKAPNLHHDRACPDEMVERIMSVLYDFPETLGLMYLVLYTTGIRINEVCSLKKDALTCADGKWWLTVYQYKMRSEKQIPVPEELCRLLKKHIDGDRSSSEYVFHSCRDPHRPYQAETFVQHMKKQLQLYDVTKDIRFRAHDYRHTIATDLHNSDAPLSITRAYLGHKRDDMTKQYIDHLPGHIDILQDKYFKENRL